MEPSRKGRIYLAGSISNDDDYRAKFAHWAEEFRNAGWEVVSPSELTESIHPNDNDREPSMRIDIPLLMTCSTIFMIEGWERSRCARCEWSIAECLEMTIVYSNEL
jgi:adenosyl cobinamide kinase/adenosyl cobinamide phosphate guanylyltransferase